MRDLINWQDHYVEYPGRFTMSTDGDGYTHLEKAPGTVKQQGTAQNAANFNTMDLAIFEAMATASEAVRMLRSMGNKVDGLAGTKLQVTLTNTQEYPFNDSVQTVQLPESRNTADYTIYPEVVSRTGGAVGDIEFSDKLVNGFKVAYCGSATQVVLNLYVRGGI